ncbi:hypothetical protein RSAG8_00002, partial [Rhizoctonia solani AG-8 WAC10335]
MFLDGLFALSVIAQRQLVSRQRNVGTDAYALSNFVTTGTLEATGAITQFTFKYLIDSTLETPSAYKTNQVVSKELVADRFFFTKRNRLFVPSPFAHGQNYYTHLDCQGRERRMC